MEEANDMFLHRQMLHMGTHLTKKSRVELIFY